MKSISFKLMALGTLLATVCGGSPLLAQGPAGGQGQVAVPRTKIALVNLQQVVKSYEKWTTFEKSYKEKYTAYDRIFEAKKGEGMALKTQLSQPTTDDRAKEQIEAKLRQLDREVQDLGNEAKKVLGKMQDDMSVQIYKEVEEAVTYYARANDLELVMHFNDATSPADMYHPVNVQRKLQTGACMPVYVAQGMDITSQIAGMLNQRYKSMMAPTGSAAPR